MNEQVTTIGGMMAIITTLCGVVVALWKNQVDDRTKAEARFEEQIQKLEKRCEDCEHDREMLWKVVAENAHTTVAEIKQRHEKR